LNGSIISRAYNEAGHLSHLLEGISHQTARDVEVVILDSGSMETTAFMHGK
jgi:rhamnosyltransferase